MKHIIHLLSVTLLVAACGHPDPVLETPAPKPIPPKVYQTATGMVLGNSITIDNRVDILFIVDNSDSMLKHTENLSSAVNAFVDGFAKNRNVDFHIGYTLVHDRVRYTPGDVPEYCPATTSRAGEQNWENSGTLKQLTFGDVGQLNKEGRRYVTAQDKDFRNILRMNLDPSQNKKLFTPYIGGKATVDLKDPQHRFLCNQGPENEESFSPLLEALTNKGLAVGANKGFRRDGAFFVAIIISDAKDDSIFADGTQMDPPRVAKLISDATGEPTLHKKRARVFSVVISTGTKISKYNSKDGTVCAPDPAFADGTSLIKGADGLMHDTHTWTSPYRVVQKDENPLETLARLTSDDGPNAMNQVFSICESGSKYGEKLAEYGARIQQDTVQDQIIQLDQDIQKLPDSDPKALHVKVAGVDLVRGQDWKYDFQTKQIHLYSSQIHWNDYPNREVTYTFTPVDVNNPDAKRSQ